MASSQFIDLNSQPILESEVLGYGESGVVIHRDSMAIKTPLRHPWNKGEIVLRLVDSQGTLTLRIAPFKQTCS
ncbi:hypothetical protein AFLA_010803 [Aspergillus flavus NRRL3357]|nr:hypothetical protein AFLA_010803 [Aspergillus flavus NRRL3357]